MRLIAFIMLLCGVLFPAIGRAQISWRMQTLPRDGSLTQPLYGAGRFFASPIGAWNGFQPTATSINGTAWALTKQSKSFRCIASNGLNHFVGIDMEGYLYSSQDGTTWTQIKDAPNANLAWGLEFSGDRYVGVCTGSGAQMYRYFYSSPDFSTWTFKDLVLPSGYYPDVSFSFYGSPICYGKGVFAVRGYKANSTENPFTLAISIFTTDTTQSSWTLRADSVGKINTSFGSIRYFNNQFVHVGQTGVHTSANGTSWIKSASAEGVPFYDVAYGNSMFVAVGPAGSVYTSKDNGVTWVKNTTNVWSNLTGVCFGGGRFICTGPFEGVLRSP